MATDTICGIDRYKDSKEFGKMVVETVILWRMPSADLKRDNVSGAVKHGDAVEILSTTHYKGELWAKVKCTIYEKEQKGWLSANLLKTLGRTK